MLQEQFEKFADRQGCSHVSEGGTTWFENGARIMGDAVAEVPADETDRLLVQRDYLDICLEREQRAFNSYKQENLNAAMVHSEHRLHFRVDPGAPEKLRAGRKRIKGWEAKIDRINKLLWETPKGRARLLREREQAEADQANAALAAEIANI